MRLKIYSKLLIFILSTSVLTYLVTISYIGLNSRKMAYEDAINLTNKIVEQYASKIETQLNADMAVIRTFSQAFLIYKDYPIEHWKKQFPEMYRKVFEKNPQFVGFWDSWEINNLDSTWNQPTGRYSYTIHRDGNVISGSWNTRSVDGDSEAYAILKQEGRETVMDPYLDVFVEGKQEQKMMTSLISPLLENGKYIGLVGGDITLDRFQNIVNEINPYEGSFAFLLSHKGFFIGHPKQDFIGKPYAEIFPETEKEFNILQNIESAKSFSISTIDKETGKKLITIFYPIKIGQSTDTWSIGISIPEDVILTRANRNFYISILVTIIGLLILTIVIWIISKNITKPITKTTEILKKIAKGQISDGLKLIVKTKDEMEEMAGSVNILIDGLNSTAGFAGQIGKGNLDAEFELLSDKDVLGNSLKEMRESLKKAKEEEGKRKLEDEKQNWVTKGLAKFGDILRQNNDNILLLSFDIMSNLISYLNANQGALFVINNDNEDEVVFELTAAIAHERQKLIEQKIKSGEGLVGRCAHEKLTIYMSDIPNDYIRITSGLGDANPSNILLVPLKLNDEVYGIIEIASFKKIKDYQIGFVEKLAENIASTLSAVKVNERTARLLNESQKQQEELSSQEEEMRQNLEEMHATQEEAARQQNEMRALWEALNQSNLVVELDPDGKILNVNDRNADLIGIPAQEMVGKYHKDFAKEATEDPEAYNEFWRTLLNGKTMSRILHINVFSKDIWIQETYTPLINKQGEIEKILNIGTDITESKIKEKELEQKVKDLERKIK